MFDRIDTTEWKVVLRESIPEKSLSQVLSEYREAKKQDKYYFAPIHDNDCTELWNAYKYAINMLEGAYPYNASIIPHFARYLKMGESDDFIKTAVYVYQRKNDAVETVRTIKDKLENGWNLYEYRMDGTDLFNKLVEIDFSSGIDYFSKRIGVEGRFVKGGDGNDCTNICFLPKGKSRRGLSLLKYMNEPLFYRLIDKYSKKVV